jgi:hypothetical protein
MGGWVNVLYLYGISPGYNETLEILEFTRLAPNAIALTFNFVPVVHHGSTHAKPEHDLNNELLWQ